tara:strand:+ start:873 stop:1691 length:819 start_codon:yes stop_codon:yes gene_type:complete
MKKIYFYFYNNFYYLYLKILFVSRVSKIYLNFYKRLSLIFKFFFNYLIIIFRLNSKYKNLTNQFKLEVDNLKFSRNWFTKNIPIWKYIFDKNSDLKFNKILEIGSYEGMSAFFLLKNFPNTKIDCVDIFEGSSEYKSDNFTNVENNLNYNLKSFEGRYTFFKMNSDNFFNKEINKNDFYDMIYIDGSHYADQVYKDAVNSFKILNINGMIIFDDFLRNKLDNIKVTSRMQKYGYESEKKNVIGGILKFIKNYNNKIKILFVGYQVFLKKISD